MTSKIPSWNPAHTNDILLDTIDVLDRMNQKDFRIKKDAVIGVLIEQREAISESPYWLDGIAYATKIDYMYKMNKKYPKEKQNEL